jgi:flagellar motor switch protein FliG
MGGCMAVEGIEKGHEMKKGNFEEIKIKVNDMLALKDTLQGIVFSFEDIIYLGNHAVQMILRQTENESLLKALKGTSTGLQEKFFSNMSKNLASQLREDFEYMGSLPLNTVLEERNKIIRIIHGLVDSGEITICKGPFIK